VRLQLNNNFLGEVHVSKNRVRLTIVALAAGTFGLLAVAGPAQAVAETGSTQTSAGVSTSISGTSVSGSLTLPPLSPNDSCWD
jgi:hypothetical protein